MKMLVAQKIQGGLALGPRLGVDLHIDGMPVKVLIDTESPVSILSSLCLFDIHRPAGADWKACVWRAHWPPVVTLRVYDDTPVKVDAKTDVTITRGMHETGASVLVHCKAMQEFLIRMDLLDVLGIQVQ